MPSGWANSKFKVGKTLLYVIVIFSTACAVFNIYINVIQLTLPLVIGNVVLLAASFIFAQVRMNKVDLSPSYEENI